MIFRHKLNHQPVLLSLRKFPMGNERFGLDLVFPSFRALITDGKLPACGERVHSDRDATEDQRLGAKFHIELYLRDFIQFT